MNPPQPSPVKRLGDLLLQQQEPFVLQVYLSERRYTATPENHHGSRSSSLLLETSSSSFSVKKKSKNGGRKPYFKVLIRGVYSKFIAIKELLRIRNCHDDDDDVENGGDRDGKVEKTRSRNQEQEDPDRYSSASISTVYTSCTENDAEEPSTSLQKDYTPEFLKLGNPKGRKFQCRCSVEGNPVSVLQDIILPQKENNSSRTRMRKITEDCILSASLWKLIFNSGKKKPMSCELEELVQSIPSPFLQSKKTLQQTKQLLFDCVREAVELQGREKRRQERSGEFMGPEEVGKIICDKMKMWGKRRDVRKLLEMEFLDEQFEFDSQRREIACQIGDAILEEEIENVMVVELSQLTASRQEK
ncbi:uncharacterized protein LOC110821012 isoform X2 [Carica papaya]|uniref:uncharacterized protein LOC110821012 isoform X2 n=1 Tax=Carica papaya TaxID=3649 RepID=UPI000B8CEA3C|nr:uncharacterized protein LOC110821012 isoform X2 [Carica papaya]